MLTFAFLSVVFEEFYKGATFSVLQIEELKVYILEVRVTRETLGAKGIMQNAAFWHFVFPHPIKHAISLLQSMFSLHT